MIVAPAGSLLDYLSQVPDLRGRQGRRHSLSAMLATVVCAILSGARGYLAISDWVQSLEPREFHLLGYTRRPPKAGAFRKLFNKLQVGRLEEVLRRWVSDQIGAPIDEAQLQAVAMDGKSLRGTVQPLQALVHLLSLYDHQAGCVLSQWRVDPNTNEAKASLELLRSIVLKGRVVTADAIFCQREVCQEIIDRKGHYFVVVKDNQPTLQADIAAEFRAAFSPGERSDATLAAGRC